MGLANLHRLTPVARVCGTQWTERTQQSELPFCASIRSSIDQAYFDNALGVMHHHSARQKAMHDLMYHQLTYPLNRGGSFYPHYIAFQDDNQFIWNENGAEKEQWATCFANAGNGKSRTTLAFVFNQVYAGRRV
jgi:hypothetical protein